MIRFRVGTSWQREDPGPGGPRDEFGLELEGFNLLPGANDEPLVRVVTGLIDTLCGIVIDGERAGQLSLEDVHLELCLWRRGGHELELSVVDLSNPPRVVRPPLLIELPALVEASLHCARALLRDISGRQEDSATQTDLIALERKVKRLSGAVIEERTHRPAQPWIAEKSEPGQPGFVLRDLEGRSLAWTRKTRAGLPPLLFDGQLSMGGATRVGLPFLHLLGLARAATQGPAAFEGQQVAPEVIFALGLEICVALRTRNGALAANPYVEALQVRCTDGLTALRQPIPDASAHVARIKGPRATPGAPLAPLGELRKVGLDARWSRPVALGEEGGHIRLTKSGVMVHSPHAVHAFTRKGETRFRHLSARGVSVTDEGVVLLSTPERLSCFRGEAPTWFRDHDGARPGTRTEEIDGVLVAVFGRRTLTGSASMTGREIWRFEPPRTQTMTVARIAHRMLVGTDGGTLYGVDVSDGQVRFRVKSGLPVVRPAVGLGKRALITLNRGEHTALYLCDALATGSTTPAGAIAWTRELILSTPTSPVAVRGKVWLAGARDGKTVVVCMNARGHQLWEKAVSCDARTAHLLPFEGGIIVTDARGAACRLLPDGSTSWVLGAADDQLDVPMPPLLRRKTLIVPGPVTRLVQPTGGRVVGELATGARMLGLAADARMTLFVLREPGTLETWVPTAALAIVKG